MFELAALDWFKIRNMDAAVVENPVECSDFVHLIGKDVLLDGAIRHVLGVERNAVPGPFRAGVLISLLLQDAEKSPALQ